MTITELKKERVFVRLFKINENLFYLLKMIDVKHLSIVFTQINLENNRSNNLVIPITKFEITDNLYDLICKFIESDFDNPNNFSYVDEQYKDILSLLKPLR